NVEGLPGMHQVNAICRGAGKPFVGAGAFGLFGYIFADCLDAHEYVEEEVKDTGETHRHTRWAAYKQLDQSCLAALNITNLKRSLRKYPPLVFICQALTSRIDKHGDVLSATELGAIVKQSLEGRGIPDGMVDEALIRAAASWGTEFVPCASVVGGTLAQEVLKVVTGRDMPVNNWCVYDALSGDGIQCNI
ncbi:SUMO-activating enzyme subunit 1, partial [Coemansia erecta]